MDKNLFSEKNKEKSYGKVLKITSLSSCLEDNEYKKKSPFYNWKEIVGEGLAENSYPLFTDKDGKRLIVAVSHSSFCISMQFLNKKITDMIKKNHGCGKICEIFYIPRPDLFKDKYNADWEERTPEEKRRISSIISDIKKLIAGKESIDNH